MNLSNKKIDLVFLLSLLVIIGGIIFLIFIGNKIGLLSKQNKVDLKNGNNIVLQTKNSAVLQKKYCDYAKKTLDWMDKKSDINGKYFTGVICDPNKKTCDQINKAGLSGHDAVPAIWARYGYIKKTGDKSQIDKLKKDIDLYFNQSKGGPVQNDFWNCKVLLEISDTSVLDNSYIEKINKICQTSTYYGTKEVVYGEVVTKIDYPDWKSLNKKNKTDIKLDSNFNGKYRFSVTYPSDFIARYKLSKNKNDLDVANVYFNGLLTNYYVDNGNFSFTDRCLLAISSLDLYSVNKDSRYLDWSKEVYGVFITKDGIKTEAFNPECAFLNRELSKYDNNNTFVYQKNEKDIIEKLISKNWDGEGGKNVLINDGGFFDVAIGGGFVYSKNLRQNALMVNLLCP